MYYEYHRLVEAVRDHGAVSESRYGETKELLAAGVVVPAGQLARRDRINDGIGWQELLQLLAGEFDRDAIRRVAPNARMDLFTPEMAYGPRVADQLPRVIAALRDDPATRQAVLFVGGPADGPTAALPCTETIQFLRRDGGGTEAISTIVSMRSWDLVKGLPYDLVMFGGLTMAVARCVGVDAGSVCVFAGSAHVYAADTHVIHKSEYAFSYADEVPRDWGEIREWAARRYRDHARGTTPPGVVVRRSARVF